VRHIHGHFLHRPGLIAGLLADLLGVSFSLSAHGRDVFVPEYRAAGLCRGAQFVSVCSEHARACLVSRLPEGFATPVHYCPHGVAIGRSPSPRTRQSGAPLRLVSVCRLVRKKGVDVILRALARLQTDGLPCRYSIIGEGPEAGGLAALSRDLGLRNVEFRGRRAPEEVRSELLAADAFVLGCRTSADGDRDGIPNVVLEAMEAMLPVIVTDAGGVSEVVRHRQTGWLVPSESPPAIAEAILELASNENLRLAVALRGRREVELRFDLWRNVERLARLFSENAGGGTLAMGPMP
jgi:glycosyltransferase involved in cell wall biosynthesis